MKRFVTFLVLNLAGIGLAGWMQFSLFDADAVKTRLASMGWRGASGPAHK